MVDVFRDTIETHKLRPSMELGVYIAISKGYVFRLLRTQAIRLHTCHSHSLRYTCFKHKR